MQILLLLLTILGGMGLSVEAGLLGPLGKEVGELWATFSIFGVGAALTFLLMLFFSPRNSPSFFTLPSWQLLGDGVRPGNQFIELPDKLFFLHVLSPRFTWIARPGMAPGWGGPCRPAVVPGFSDPPVQSAPPPGTAG